jgi:hypothetical protein
MDDGSRVATTIEGLNLAGQNEHDLWTILTVVNRNVRRYRYNDDRRIWEDVRDSVRAAINERVRPKLRPLTILDLPDELLRHVFEYLSSETGMYELHFYPRHNASEIKNVRLACRRFHMTSSHLLLHQVKVALTPQSLAHLNEVSRHPLVTKGVRAVILHLGPFYDSSLAGDIRTFAAYQAFKLRDCIEGWERQIEWQIDKTTPAKVYQDAIAKAIPLAESFEEAAADQGIDTTRADHLILAGIHAQYCQRYEHHKTICGSFGQVVASAMMRMPSATWVQLDDQDIFEMGRSIVTFPGDMHDHGLLREKLMSPLDWRDARVHALGPPPFGIIGDLLVSLHQLGIHLKGLDINTPPPTSGGLLNTPTITPNAQDLCITIQQLKAIQFRPLTNISGVDWAERAADEWTPFIGFLSRLVHTKSLEKIDLSFYFMCDDDLPPSLSMAPIIMSYAWPNLKMLHFNGPFHLEELRTVVQRLEKDVNLEWSGYLLSGSWAEVLDIVREYDSHETCIGDVNRSVYGQEADEMTRQEWDFIFKAGIRIYELSRATKYTLNNRRQKSNPVRDWENGELFILEEELVSEHE